MTFNTRRASVVFSVILVMLVSFLGAYSAISGGSTGRSISQGSSSKTVTSSSQSAFIGQWFPVYLNSNSCGFNGATKVGCWGDNLSEAVKFNCLTKAESSEGCEQVVHMVNSTAVFEVWVWFGYVDDLILVNGQHANCTFNYSPVLEASPPAAFCPLLNSTTFVLAELDTTAPA